MHVDDLWKAYKRQLQQELLRIAQSIVKSKYIRYEMNGLQAKSSQIHTVNML